MEHFKIPLIPQTTNKSIRFPNNIISDVEKAIEGKDCTFTAFVVEAVRVALKNIESEDSVITTSESKKLVKK
ncbi:MAG: YlcI/YnfO family protein [Bacillota bacterium]|nr:YlcI/YnfO family protein [Bacillota bacterium]